MGNSVPLLSKEIIEHNIDNFRTVAVSMQGQRPEMEDALVCVSKFPQFPTKWLVGVFDGHCGAGMSKLLSRDLFTALNQADDLSPAKIRDICVELDTAYVAQQRSPEAGNVASQPGSTAVFAIIEKLNDSPTFKILSCNVGDSRILLIDAEEGSFKPLTEDHKPDNDVERERIINAGGSVQSSRVDGSLALSRAFGDASYKMNDSLDHCSQKVIPVPDFMQAEAKAGQIILVACDGVFEACNNHEIAEFIIRAVSEGKDLKDITVALVDYCITQGSNDNISCQLIRIEKEAFPAIETKECYLPAVYFSNGGQRFKKSFLKETTELGLDSNAVKAVAPKSALKKVESHDLPGLIKSQLENPTYFPLRRVTPIEGLLNLPREFEAEPWEMPFDEFSEAADEEQNEDQDAMIFHCLHQIMAQPGGAQDGQFAFLKQLMGGNRKFEDDGYYDEDEEDVDDEDDEDGAEDDASKKIEEVK